MVIDNNRHPRNSSGLSRTFNPKGFWPVAWRNRAGITCNLAGETGDFSAQFRFCVHNRHQLVGLHPTVETR